MDSSPETVDYAFVFYPTENELYDDIAMFSFHFTII
jgi:hypothetical protein